jgi:apolipoprotein D and lipocalin family protein
MSRERNPRGEVLQAAYGVLDKFKMNRAFFIKTDQENCETLPPIVEAVDTTPASKNEIPVKSETLEKVEKVDAQDKL